RSRSSDFPAGLGNANGLVGRYLHDHPREWWRAHTDPPLPPLSHPVYISPPPGTSSDPPMATSLTIGLHSTVPRLPTSHARPRPRRAGVRHHGADAGRRRDDQSGRLERPARAAPARHVAL